MFGRFSVLCIIVLFLWCVGGLSLRSVGSPVCRLSFVLLNSHWVDFELPRGSVEVVSSFIRIWGCRWIVLGLDVLLCCCAILLVGP